MNRLSVKGEPGMTETLYEQERYELALERIRQIPTEQSVPVI